MQTHTLTNLGIWGWRQGGKREITSELKKGPIIWVPKALTRALTHILSFDLLFSLTLRVKNDQGYLSTFRYPVFRDQHASRKYKCIRRSLWAHTERWWPFLERVLRFRREINCKHLHKSGHVRIECAKLSRRWITQTLKRFMSLAWQKQTENKGVLVFGS